MLSNYYYYYSCPRLLVLLLSLLLQPQASIVTYSYEFLLPLLFYLLYHSCRCYYLYILLLLYLLYLLFTYTVRYLPLYITAKRERHFCTFLSVMNFSCSFYSLQSSHVLFCNALPTAAAFYPLCDWQLSNGC